MIAERLKALARTVERVPGREIFILEDKDIIKLGEAHKIPPAEIAAVALEHDIVPHRYIKNLNTLSPKEQAAICRSRLLVCGCGGLGGAIIHLAARAGFGFIRCVDPDMFSPSNANRQWFCFTSTMGISKAGAVKEMTQLINPLVTVEALTEKIDETHLQGIDIAVDALDNVPDRLSLDGWCNRLGVPLIHGAVRGWWGQVLTLAPDTSVRLNVLYGEEIEEARATAEESLGVLAPTVSTVASLQVAEAIRLAAGQPAAFAERLLYIDLERGDFHKIPLCQALTP